MWQVIAEGIEWYTSDSEEDANSDVSFLNSMFPDLNVFVQKVA